MSKRRKQYAKRLHSLEARLWNKKIYVLVFVLIACALFGGLLLLRDKTTDTYRVSDSKIVILSEGESHITTSTREKTVSDFLTSAQVAINEGDVVEPSLTTEIVEDNFRINIYRARPVLVIDNQSQKTVSTAAFTPRSIAEEAGFVIYPEDKVKITTNTDVILQNELVKTVEIDRATEVNIILYGTPTTLRTRLKTVGELLVEKNIVLNGSDTLSPSVDTLVTSGLQITVTRYGTEVSTVEETIPKPTEYVEDASLSFGTTAVRQEGSDGKRSVTYEISYVNNTESSRKIIQQVVITEPVAKIVARGKTVSIPVDKTEVMKAAGIAESDYAYVNYIISRESGWRYTARNASSGAYGLCQALPGTKMASAGADWESNPVTQLRWCTSYAVGRYGSWAGAYNFWLGHNWW